MEKARATFAVMSNSHQLHMEKARGTFAVITTMSSNLRHKYCADCYCELFKKVEKVRATFAVLSNSCQFKKKQ
eukprot:12246389-Ditylum_brightwellii.AAC.1